MSRLLYLTHPQVCIDPQVPVPDWGLNDEGRARCAALASRGALARVTRVVSSTERKAVETAALLAAPIGLPPEAHADLGENDRSATGFLAGPAFEATVDRFFAAPEQGADGWERAVDAQARVVARVKMLLAEQGRGDLLVCGHGAVGTLLYCHLAGLPIDRRHDQIEGGGCWFAVPLPSAVPTHHWQPMETL